MNKGRLFFDPLRFKKFKAEEDRRKKIGIVMIATSVLAILVFISLNVFGFSLNTNINNFDSVLVAEADLSVNLINGITQGIHRKIGIENSALACSDGINLTGDKITTERIEAKKIALEEQRLLEEKKKKEKEKKKRLLALASKPKTTSSKPATNTSSDTSVKGGDVKKIDIDLNNEYLPVNPEELDPTGNYGIPEYWPIQGVPVSSKYGYLPSRGRNHAGVDLVADSGTPICAAGAGKIIRASWYSGYGNCIDIQHSSGYVTRYGHLSGYFVKVGDFVNPGEWIGSCGSTGRSSCPHLHFEVHKNGKSMNPESKNLIWTGKP